MSCPACTASGEPAFSKSGTVYYDCRECGTLFVPGGLEQGGMVGGTGEADRALQNKERVQRFRSLGATEVLDYGCGNGALVWECNYAGLSATGFDPFSEKFKDWPYSNPNLVSMIEVVEHLTSIPAEITRLQSGTWLYIESSFRGNRTLPELGQWDYVNPSIGHSTIWSERGIDGALAISGFQSQTPFNQHVRVYRKI